MIHEFILAGYQYFFLCRKTNELESDNENILNAKSDSSRSNYVLVVSLQSFWNSVVSAIT